MYMSINMHRNSPGLWPNDVIDQFCSSSLFVTPFIPQRGLSPRSRPARALLGRSQGTPWIWSRVPGAPGRPRGDPKDPLGTPQRTPGTLPELPGTH